MTLQSDRARFARDLRSAFNNFREQERQIRRQYARGADATPQPLTVLERASRRFLIDSFLRALDWNPDNPDHMAEEARASTLSGERLYFDYLGLNAQRHAPVLLFEAKGYDVPLPREAHGTELDSNGMSYLIAEAVDAIKRGNTSLPVISEWGEFLRSMHTYISALDELGRTTLRRAAISAGQWLIVFSEPLAIFLNPGPANVEHILCFTNMEAILEASETLYKLLHRTYLVDTLPFTLKVPEALQVIPRRGLGDCFRAVLVATSSSSGARRQPYPTRAVYSALVVRSGGRWFAIVDYDKPVEEPKRADQMATFLAQLGSNGEALQERLALRYVQAFRPRPIDEFLGFEPISNDHGSAFNVLEPTDGSTAARTQTSEMGVRILVTATGESGMASEFIVVTGAEWFYKYGIEENPRCEFHSWIHARRASVAAPYAHSGYAVDSFTDDGDAYHCAHQDLLSLRADRCHLLTIETHLCCQMCLFVNDCWGSVEEIRRLPCPDEAVRGDDLLP